MLNQYLLPTLTCFGMCLGTMSQAQSTPSVPLDYPQNAICVDGADKPCSQMPADLPGLHSNAGYTPSTDASVGDLFGQTPFDYFSWQMFVALNWPAENGVPSTTQTIANVTLPRVWESYETPVQVFGGPVSTCQSGGARLVLSEISKLHSAADIEPFTSYPLIDSAGNFVVYDIRMNDREVAYIKGGNDKGLDLSTLANQKAFDQKWDFFTGLDTTPGALEMKSAWRVFPDGQAPAGFFTLPGMVTVEPEFSANGQQLCLPVTLGLVGMHLIQKITNPDTFSEFWVWSTFEHKDNAPNSTEALVSATNDALGRTGNDPLASCTAPGATGQSWSFYNDACSVNGASCPANGPPTQNHTAKTPYLWQPGPPYAKNYLWDGKFGTQVSRCWDIYPSADTVTAQFQTALAGTPWANYRLVGTQWAQSHNTEFPDPLLPFPAPIYLTNTTLETYLQLNPVIDPQTGKPSQNAPGSCIICHAMATDAANNDSNFSFLPGRAK